MVSDETYWSQGDSLCQGVSALLHAAEIGCNNTYDEHVLFSWLSSQQRLALIEKVMVGLFV